MTMTPEKFFANPKFIEAWKANLYKIYLECDKNRLSKDAIDIVHYSLRAFDDQNQKDRLLFNTKTLGKLSEFSRKNKMISNDWSLYSDILKMLVTTGVLAIDHFTRTEKEKQSDPITLPYQLVLLVETFASFKSYSHVHQSDAAKYLSNKLALSLLKTVEDFVAKVKSDLPSSSSSAMPSVAANMEPVVVSNREFGSKQDWLSAFFGCDAFFINLIRIPSHLSGNFNILKEVLDKFNLTDPEVVAYNKAGLDSSSFIFRLAADRLSLSSSQVNEDEVKKIISKTEGLLTSFFGDPRVTDDLSQKALEGLIVDYASVPDKKQEMWAKYIKYPFNVATNFLHRLSFLTFMKFEFLDKIHINDYGVGRNFFTDIVGNESEMFSIQMPTNVDLSAVGKSNQPEFLAENIQFQASVSDVFATARSDLSDIDPFISDSEDKNNVSKDHKKSLGLIEEEKFLATARSNSSSAENIISDNEHEDNILKGNEEIFMSAKGKEKSEKDSTRPSSFPSASIVHSSFSSARNLHLPKSLPYDSSRKG